MNILRSWPIFMPLTVFFSDFFIHCIARPWLKTFSEWRLTANQLRFPPSVLWWGGAEHPHPPVYKGILWNFLCSVQWVGQRKSLGARSALYDTLVLMLALLSSIHFSVLYNSFIFPANKEGTFALLVWCSAKHADKPVLVRNQALTPIHCIPSHSDCPAGFNAHI